MAQDRTPRIFEDGTCENPGDSHIHSMGLWDRWELGDISEDGTRENPIDSLSIPWDCETEWDIGF